MSVRSNIAIGIVLVASLYIIFMAVVGYGFGQLFFGTFSWVATLCALSALGSIFGAALCAGKTWCRGALALLSLIAILCFGLEVFDYYWNFHAPGNSFAWDINGPFILSLAIVFAANLYGWLHRPNKSLKRTREG